MDIVCFSDINWDFLWQRHQQLLTRFPKHWKILFIEPSFLGVVLEDPQKIIPRHVADNITVVSLPTLPFFDRSRLPRTINDTLIVFWTRFFMRRLHLSNPVIMIYEPRFSCVVGKLGEVLSCYEVVDDRLEFSKVPRWIKDNVDFLTKNVDLVTVSANTLYSKILKKREEDLYIIGNGVDIDHFMKAGENIPLPPDILNVAKPIAGYIGAIGEWFDFQLIEMILRQCPDMSVVLIGPVFPEQTGLVKKLESTYPNMHVLGKKPYSVLPHYIKAFDVCLIPFQINELTKGVNPNKAYEYAAAGKPIVSTYLPELDRYRHVIHVAKDHVEFVDGIRGSINSKPDVDGLLRIAEENTWDNRSEDFVRLFTRYVSHKAVCSGFEV